MAAQKPRPPRRGFTIFTSGVWDYSVMATDSSYTSSSTKPLFRGTQIVWYVLGVIEVLLGFRFLLKLLAANPGAAFTSFIYNLSYPFAVPFLSVFRITRVEGSIFEWPTLLAMVVYWLVALGIVRLFLMSRSVSTPEAAARLEEEEKGG